MSRALSTLLAPLLLLAGALPVAADDPKVPAPDEPGPPPVTTTSSEVVPGEVIVKFRDEARGAEVMRAQGLSVASDVGARGKGLPDVVAVADRPVELVLSELRADPAVEYAEPSYVVHLVNEGSVSGVPVNDPMTSTQYSLDRMRVRDAWSIETGGSGVIAVLDTGVQATHPDLIGRVLPGYDFVNNDSNAADDNTHGTWVAGIIAANANDGYGIAGISWSDKILPVKIMNQNGLGSTADLVDGIVWAADHGATVINMSVGGFPYSQAVQDAINYAWGKGVVLVGAAGNNNRNETFYPASMANVISVSATQRDDEFSYWSSYGPKVDVSAPGSSVLTTNCTSSACLHPDWGSHYHISGTSFATPNVSGVVALIRAKNPGWTPSQVATQLINTVDDLGYAGQDDRYGRGRVNAYRALGASVAASPRPGGDAVEANNVIGSARTIGLGSTMRPSIYPAGDIDYFAVDVPRAGRLDVRVTGVVDNRAYPWHKSTLKMDPVVELYDTAGRLLKRVDAVWENGTELAQWTVGGPTRIIVRIHNYFANGNRSAYSITPSFVDTAAPGLSARNPGPSGTNANYEGPFTATFNEAVTGVSASTFVLKDAGGNVVPATVSYSASSRRASLTPNAPLAPEKAYSLHLTSGIKDSVGHSLVAQGWSFTTGKAVPRLAGSTRFDTAAVVSRSVYGAGVPVVYVATGMTYPDALAGGPAARAAGGPLLLTETKRVSPATAAELTRLQPKRIVVLGGASAVSSGVVADLSNYTTGEVKRISGADRFVTAAEISRDAFPNGSTTVYIATGENYPDALAAGAVAARVNAPILLVRSDALPAVTDAELARLDPDRIVVMGGAGAISDAVLAKLAAHGSVSRLSGADRYATAVELTRATFGDNSVSTVYIATGRSFPDGLSAGPVAGKAGAPLLLVPGTSLPATVAAELKRLDPTRVVIIGGSSVVSDALRSQIRMLWP